MMTKGTRNWTRVENPVNLTITAYCKNLKTRNNKIFMHNIFRKVYPLAGLKRNVLSRNFAKINKSHFRQNHLWKFLTRQFCENMPNLTFAWRFLQKRQNSSLICNTSEIYFNSTLKRKSENFWLLYQNLQNWPCWNKMDYPFGAKFSLKHFEVNAGVLLTKTCHSNLNKKLKVNLLKVKFYKICYKIFYQIRSAATR